MKLLTVDCSAIDERPSTVSTNNWSRNANFDFKSKKSILNVFQAQVNRDL